MAGPCRSKLLGYLKLDIDIDIDIDGYWLLRLAGVVGSEGVAVAAAAIVIAVSRIMETRGELNMLCSDGLIFDLNYLLRYHSCCVITLPSVLSFRSWFTIMLPFHWQAFLGSTAQNGQA